MGRRRLLRSCTQLSLTWPPPILCINAVSFPLSSRPRLFVEATLLTQRPNCNVRPITIILQAHHSLNCNERLKGSFFFSFLFFVFFYQNGTKLLSRSRVIGVKTHHSGKLQLQARNSFAGKRRRRRKNQDSQCRVQQVTSASLELTHCSFSRCESCQPPETRVIDGPFSEQTRAAPLEMADTIHIQ